MIELGDKVFEYGHYPDGTLNIKLDGFDPDYFTVRSDNVVHWYYDCEEELVALSYLVKEIRNNYIESVYLICHMFPMPVWIDVKMKKMFLH